MNHKLVEMLQNGSENEKLFEKNVPVTIKDTYTNESWTSHLFITMKWQKAPAGKVLSILLTDNDDPFFLYSLYLHKEDYQMLQANLGITHEFSSFPQKLIGFFEQALLEEKNPKSYLVFIRSGNPSVAEPSQLDIIQVNDFRPMSYILLTFLAATDSAVRQHINATFKCFKEEKRQLQNNLAFLEQDLKDKLGNCDHTLRNKVQELELLRKEMIVELTKKDSNHQMELQIERDKLINRHKDEINKLEKQMKANESNFRIDIQQLESNVHVLETLKKELQDKNLRNESTIRELKSRVLFLEDESKRLKENLQSYKCKCNKLQSDVKEKMSHIRQQDEIITEANQELRSKEQSILKLKERIASEIEQKKLIENELEEIKFRRDMCEKQRQALQNDTEKLNNVIIDLQDKLQEASKEEKTKNHEVAKYKEIVEENEKTLLNMKYKIEELNITLQTKISEVQSLTDSKHILQKCLEDTRKELREKEQVVKWLNQQMSENFIVPQYVPPPHLSKSPSAVAQKQLAKISSKSPENSPSVIPRKNTASKSIRKEGGSPVCKGNSSTPSHFQKTRSTDSAYCTTSIHSNQGTPEVLAGSHKVNFDPENFEADPEALNAMFGNVDLRLKHSTAKKPVKSNTPKNSKKR